VNQSRSKENALYLDSDLLFLYQVRFKLEIQAYGPIIKEMNKT